MKETGIITPFIKNGETIAYIERYVSSKKHYVRQKVNVMGHIEQYNAAHSATILGDGSRLIATDCRLVKYNEMFTLGIQIPNVIEKTGYVTFKCIPTISLVYNEEKLVVGKGGAIDVKNRQYIFSPVKSLLEYEINQLHNMLETSGEEFQGKDMNILETAVRKAMLFTSMKFQNIVYESFMRATHKAAKEYGVHSLVAAKVTRL